MGLPSSRFENPNPNPSRYLGLRAELIERVEAFIGDGRTLLRSTTVGYLYGLGRCSLFGS